MFNEPTNIPSERIDPLNNLSLRYSELIHLKRYSIVSKYADGKVLDIACGLGYGAIILKRNTSIQYFGVDIDEHTIVQSRVKYGYLGKFLRYEEKNGIPYKDETFDTICSLETIEHVEKERQPAFYLELLRVLKTGGILVISTPNRNYKTKIALKKSGWNNPYHKYEFETDEFRQFLLTNIHHKVQILKSYYLGLPYNVTGVICKTWLSKFFRRFPCKVLEIIDVIDINVGFLFPANCNSLVFVIRKNG